jgi:hypothetical protein
LEALVGGGAGPHPTAAAYLTPRRVGVTCAAPATGPVSGLTPSPVPGLTSGPVPAR